MCSMQKMAHSMLAVMITLLVTTRWAHAGTISIGNTVCTSYDCSGGSCGYDCALIVKTSNGRFV